MIFCRLRRAAPSIMVLGLVVMALSTATAAVAQMALAGKTTEDIASLVIDRLAYLVIANVTVWALAAVGMWRWSGMRLKEANGAAIKAHDEDEDAHKAAAHRNHEPMYERFAELDSGMAVVLAEIRALRQMLQPISELEARLREIEKEHAAFHAPRDPASSPHRQRHNDLPGFDGAKHRGRA